MSGGTHRSGADTTEGNKPHEGFVSAAVDDAEPDGGDDERDHEEGAGYGLFEEELAGSCELEEDEADKDAVADHAPAGASRVLAMVHGVEELVFVDGVAEGEVGEGGEEDLPGGAEDAVDESDDED